VKRGDIFYIEIPYATGHEMEKDRPGIVVSATAANVMRDVVQVVFCSASTQHQMPEHVEIHSTPRRSTAMCEHIYTVDKSRVGTYIGTATPEEMEQLEAALSKALALGAKSGGGGVLLLCTEGSERPAGRECPHPLRVGDLQNHVRAAIRPHHRKEQVNMSNIKVTKEQIDLLMNSADVKVETTFDKCTVVTMRLRNGFILTESSACVDPANYDVEQGKKLCYEHIENRLWELEGYAMQKSLYEREAGGACCCKDDCQCEAATGDFGWALDQMHAGKRVRRQSWNGKGQYVFLAQCNEMHTDADISEFADGNGVEVCEMLVLRTAQRNLQPGWLASQSDMLSTDWELAK